jgi:hypothetical protein
MMTMKLGLLPSASGGTDMPLGTALATAAAAAMQQQQCNSRGVVE